MNLTILLITILTIFIGINALIIQYVISKLTSNKNIKDINIEKAVRDGVKSAFEEIEYKKEQETDFIQKSKKTNKSLGIYTSTFDSGPVETDGDLIPYGVTEEEKEVLRLFYHK